MFGVWPSGKAAAFDAAMPGSNPATPANLGDLNDEFFSFKFSSFLRKW